MHLVWKVGCHGQTLMSAGCVRELCAWGCHAMERRHCQDSQAHGNWGMEPTQEALLGCPPSLTRCNCSPCSPSAYGHGSAPCTLPRTALTSYSLRKPTRDLAAFWA